MSKKKVNRSSALKLFTVSIRIDQQAKQKASTSQLLLTAAGYTVFVGFVWVMRQMHQFQSVCFEISSPIGPSALSTYRAAPEKTLLRPRLLEKQSYRRQVTLSLTAVGSLLFSPSIFYSLLFSAHLFVFPFFSFLFGPRRKIEKKQSAETFKLVIRLSSSYSADWEAVVGFACVSTSFKMEVGTKSPFVSLFDFVLSFLSFLVS